MTKSETISQTIRDAVRERYLLRLNYHNFSRVVQPESIDVDDCGHEILVALQLSGGCDSGEAFGMKRFLISEILGAGALTERY